MMYENYLINVKSFLCNYELFVNDILVDSQYNDNYITSELPINQWLNCKANIVNAKVIPLKNQNALEARGRVEVQIINLKENKKDNSQSQRIIITTLNTLPEQDVNQENLPYLERNKIFLIHDEFKLPWINSPVFSINQNNTSKIIELYKNIHQAFRNKDINSIMEMFRKKNTSCALALNENEEDFLNYIKDGYMAIWNDAENILWPLNRQQLIPKFFAGNKVVALYNELNQPVILYYNQNQNACTFIDIYLMNDENNELTIIR